MASIGKSLKKIGEQKGLMLQEVAFTANMKASNYSKIESGQRDISVDALDKIAPLLGMTVDEIIHYEDSKKPTPVKVEDKTLVYRIIDGRLTKNMVQTFFEQNIAVK